MRFSMPPQVSRLLMLTAAIGVVYLIALYFMVPPSFGQYGWYRGNALKEIASLPTTLAGREACAECHADKMATLTSGSHKTMACETCHGPSKDHAQDPTINPRTVPNGPFCLRCHQATVSRPAWFPQVDLEEHFGDSCRECHLPHSPTEAPSE